VKLYLFNVLVGFDQFMNTILGGAPGETVSGRAWQAKLDGDLWGKYVVAFLNIFETDHCKEAWEKERLGRHIAAL
jgi:hypothetical protein